MPDLVNPIYKILFSFLRCAAGNSDTPITKLTPEEWQKLFVEAKRQSVLDVVYTVFQKLPKENLPPKPLLMRWAAHAEATRDMNKRMNAEAARLTEIFSKEGRHTAVLKGAANARLYPDPLSRQCGDIDFWVDGGFKSVEDLLLKLKFISEHEETSCRHHIHMPKNKDGVTVEIHYRPASGNPYKNGELQKYLNKEILNSELVPEGFYSPTIKFALVMQLSHLQQHFYSKGLGFRQFMDYFILLKHSTENDRREVADIMKSLYMLKACGAVMWMLEEIFGLERELMLCPPVAWRGKRLMKLALDGGNFGQYDPKRLSRINVFVRWFNDRLRALSWIPFDPVNAIFKELKYWRATISVIPLRIKRRKIAL